MTSFVPPGCISCFDTLNEIHTAKHYTTKRVPDHHWEGAFKIQQSKMGFSDLSWKDAERMRETVLALQEELYLGKRTACYPDKLNLTNMKRELFTHEKATEFISRGRVQSGMWSVDPVNVPIFIRMTIESSQWGKPDAPPKRLQLAKDYWHTFPQGHQASKRTWQQACGDIEKAVGRESVPLQSLKDALRDFPDPPPTD